ncbi:hypothetical protein FVE85_2118 [Porphyridium purpureum]|uniref:Uncharacterized protein n=1 Tax=Porphyridium purpureum TaxID=35688 RepID=A0A5J4YZB1_PORPP|nr:hypothetical protein FVE85_2118 [Porphyridium purpureum]|eukprot:POR0138..scf209_3
MAFGCVYAALARQQDCSAVRWRDRNAWLHTRRARNAHICRCLVLRLARQRQVFSGEQQQLYRQSRLGLNEWSEPRKKGQFSDEPWLERMASLRSQSRADRTHGDATYIATFFAQVYDSIGLHGYNTQRAEALLRLLLMFARKNTYQMDATRRYLLNSDFLEKYLQLWEDIVLEHESKVFTVETSETPSLIEKAECIGVITLCSVLHSFAAMDVFPGRKFIRLWCILYELQPDRASPRSLSTAFWCLARFGTVPSFELTTILNNSLAVYGDEFSATELANVVWSVSRLLVRPRTPPSENVSLSDSSDVLDWQAFLSAMESCHCAYSFSPIELQNILYGVTRLIDNGQAQFLMSNEDTCQRLWDLWWSAWLKMLGQTRRKSTKGGAASDGVQGPSLSVTLGAVTRLACHVRIQEDQVRNLHVHLHNCRHSVPLRQSEFVLGFLATFKHVPDLDPRVQAYFVRRVSRYCRATVGSDDISYVSLEQGPATPSNNMMGDYPFLCTVQKCIELETADFDVDARHAALSKILKLNCARLGPDAIVKSIWVLYLLLQKARSQRLDETRLLPLQETTAAWLRSWMRRLEEIAPQLSSSDFAGCVLALCNVHRKLQVESSAAARFPGKEVVRRVTALLQERLAAVESEEKELYDQVRHSDEAVGGQRPYMEVYACTEQHLQLISRAMDLLRDRR